MGDCLVSARALTLLALTACEPVDTHLADVELRVPAGLRDRFQFVDHVVKLNHEQTTAFTVAIPLPSGWYPDPWPWAPNAMSREMWNYFQQYTYEHSHFLFGDRCSYFCEKRDWGAVIDREVLDERRRHALVLFDHVAPTERVFVSVDSQRDIHVFSAWWHEGDTSYMACRAFLQDDPSVYLVNAFLAACRNMHAFRTVTSH